MWGITVEGYDAVTKITAQKRGLRRRNLDELQACGNANGLRRVTKGGYDAVIPSCENYGAQPWELRRRNFLQLG